MSTNSYTESYRRFYFSDIQAIICQHTRAATVWSVATAACAIVSLILAVAFYFQSRDAFVLTGFCLLAFLISASVLIINLVRGPSCVAHIATAVQTTPLPYVSRWRKAQKLVDELKPRIATSQSPSSPAVEEGRISSANG